MINKQLQIGFRSMIALREDRKYTDYENNTDYEIDNNFLFDLLQRTKYNEYLKFVNNNLEDFEDYYFDDRISSEKSHIKMYKEFNIKTVSAFRQKLQVKLGIDLKELLQYFKKTKSNKLHRAVTITKQYNENGDIEYQAVDSSSVLSLFHPEAVIYVQNLTRPTIRFNRASVILTELNLNLEDSAIVDYINQLRKYHKKSADEFSLTDLLSYNQSPNDILNRQKSKRYYYGDLLFVYDKIERFTKHHQSKRNKIYENTLKILKKLNTKDENRNNANSIRLETIEEYNKIMEELIFKLEQFINNR